MFIPTTLAALIFVMLFAVNVWAQLRYARRGYPKSWRWRSFLFLAGMLFAYVFLSLFSVLETSRDSTQESRLTAQSIRLGISCLSGIAYAWLFQFRLRSAIPKQ